MKKIIALSFASLVVLASCKKECIAPENSGINSESTDFISSTNINADGTRNAEFSKSNMKIAIRKVANKLNTYKLVMKIDSVAVEMKDANGVPQFVMIALDDFDKVAAGVTVVNTENPAESKPIFGKESMRIRKVRESGTIVYESDAFQTDVNFDFELVEIDYTISGKWTFDDGHGVDNSSLKEIPFTIDGKHNFFMLPSGKAVYQNPSVAKIDYHGKWTHSNGRVFVKTMNVTIENDPAESIETLEFVPDPIKIETKDPKNPYIIIQLKSIGLEKVFSNPIQGVSKFTTPKNRIEEAYGDGKIPWEWTGSGVIYSKDKYGNNKIVKYGQCMIYSALM